MSNQDEAGEKLPAPPEVQKDDALPGNEVDCEVVSFDQIQLDELIRIDKSDLRNTIDEEIDKLQERRERAFGQEILSRETDINRSAIAGVAVIKLDRRIDLLSRMRDLCGDDPDMVQVIDAVSSRMAKRSLMQRNILVAVLAVVSLIVGWLLSAFGGPVAVGSLLFHR